MRLLKPNRRGTLVSLAVGVAFGSIGAALLVAGSSVGIAVGGIGAVGIYGAIGGIVPGQGLRLDEEGFRLRSFGKSWGAKWPEIARFTPDQVQVSRWRRGGTVDVVRIGYLQGVDKRYLIAAYGGLSSPELATLLERYRIGSADDALGKP